MPPFDCEPLTLTFSLKETPELDQIFGYEALEPMPKEDNFYPKKIIKSGLVTVVLWKDGTKTVVRCAGDETYSLYNAFVSALAKKVYGSNSAVKRIIDNAVTVQKPKKKPEMEWNEIMMDCPACGGRGTLTGTRADNGHFHGRCEACGTILME